MSDSGNEEPEEVTIATDLVVTKYKMGAEIVNACLKTLLEKCLPGAKVYELCEFGDKYLAEETSKVFKKEKSMKKGIAFPTCVSVNNCICHFSPLKSDADVILKEGDMVKIDLGAQVDGYPAVAAHTTVIGASQSNKITDKRADVILAAYNASEAAVRLVKPGNENWSVTEAISKAAESFKCKPVQDILSHQLKQHVIDGEKTIIQNPTEEQKFEQEKEEFGVHEVYAVDVIVSSGEGKGREQDARTTVYKKKEGIYNLKMKASRQFYSEVDKRFGTMPFSLRMMEDEKKAKMGVVECVKHQLMDPFGVLYERESEFVAQFKFTLLLMPNGPMRITGLPLDTSIYESQYKIEDEELKTLLASSASRKAQKKKKKKAGKMMTDAGAVDGATPNSPEEATES